jgi:hypothetical protein
MKKVKLVLIRARQTGRLHITLATWFGTGVLGTGFEGVWDMLPSTLSGDWMYHARLAVAQSCGGVSRDEKCWIVEGRRGVWALPKRSAGGLVFPLPGLLR